MVTLRILEKMWLECQSESGMKPSLKSPAKPQSGFWEMILKWWVWSDFLTWEELRANWKNLDWSKVWSGLGKNPSLTLSFLKGDM